MEGTGCSYIAEGVLVMRRHRRSPRGHVERRESACVIHVPLMRTPYPFPAAPMCVEKGFLVVREDVLGILDDFLVQPAQPAH